MNYFTALIITTAHAGIHKIGYYSRIALLHAKAVTGDRRSVFEIHMRSVVHADSNQAEMKHWHRFIGDFEPDKEELQEMFAATTHFMSFCSQELKECVIDELFKHGAGNLSTYILGSILGETVRQSVIEKAAAALLTGKHSYQSFSRAAGAVTLKGRDSEFDDETAKAIALPLKHALLCASTNAAYLRYIWQYNPELRAVVDALYPDAAWITHVPYGQFDQPSIMVHIGEGEPDIDFSDPMLQERIERTKPLLNNPSVH